MTVVEGLYSGLSPQCSSPPGHGRTSISGGARRMSTAGAAAQAAAIEAKMVSRQSAAQALSACLCGCSFLRRRMLFVPVGLLYMHLEDRLGVDSSLINR